MTSPRTPDDPAPADAQAPRRLTRGRTAALAVAATLVVAWLAMIALAHGDPDPVRAKGGRIAVTMDDFSFSIERIRTRPGPFRMDVRNVGSLPHALVLLRLPNKGEAGRVITRRPGESGALEVDKLNRGTYRYICPLSHHEELGMRGEIRVR